MKPFRFVLSFAMLPWLFAAYGSAQEVHNTSYSTKTGERVLRIETIVPAPVDQVWKAWTTPDGLKAWVAPVVAIDFRIGGTISTNYDSKARIGESGTITLPIVNYIENQLITLRVNLNGSFARKARDEDQNLQEIVQIADVGNGKTKVISSMVGWGAGKEWDDTYAFFARGNEWTYQQLAKYLSRAESVREQVSKIVTAMQRADYEGDRVALKHDYVALTPFVENKELASRVLYWRGFALWRRALNGFNDNVDPEELKQDLEQGVKEFEAASAKDPAFADAKVGAGSCLSNLLYIYRKDPAKVQELLAKAVPMLKQAEAEAPNNPRLFWVLGPNRWYAPPERGGGQDKALATYQKGLDAVRENKANANMNTHANDPLEPSWGEPELLMNLAWSNLHLTSPNLAAADADARSALELVPYWHYVRDTLLPQIHSAIDIGGIQKLRDQDVAASKSGDFGTLNTLFTEDAVVMPPASDFVRGRQQRQTNLAKMREATSQYRVIEYREDFEELKIYGNEAVEWGTISGKMQDTKTGSVEASAYKVMRMLRKQPSGEWKIARSIYNDIPPKVQN